MWSSPRLHPPVLAIAAGNTIVQHLPVSFQIAFLKIHTHLSPLSHWLGGGRIICPSVKGKSKSVNQAVWEGNWHICSTAWIMGHPDPLNSQQCYHSIQKIISFPSDFYYWSYFHSQLKQILTHLQVFSLLPQWVYIDFPWIHPAQSKKNQLCFVFFIISDVNMI